MRELARLSIAVDTFANAMERKLVDKFYEGYEGWDNPSYEVEIISNLQEHVASLIAGESKQAVDVANLAMMLKDILEQKENSKEDSPE